MIEIEETGYIPVKINGEEKSLDLYETYNRVAELCKEFEGKTAREYHEAVRGYLQSIGFPECSHGTAMKFSEAIIAHVQGLQKKVESAESPSPTPN